MRGRHGEAKLENWNIGNGYLFIKITMEEINAKKINKIQLSLAALMFFSPLIKYMLNKGNVEINEEEKKFVNGYIKLGYIGIIFLIITITSGISNYLINSGLLNLIYWISIIILILLMLIGIICILADVKIFQDDGNLFKKYELNINKKNILLFYIPIYNIFLWYKIHNFDKPNRYLKESILFRGFFVLIALIGNVFLIDVMLILIIIRIGLLMSGMEFLSVDLENKLNKCFKKNPEELRGYITGSLVFGFKYLVNKFKKSENLNINYFWDKEKEDFSHLYDVKEIGKIKIEYGIGIILLIIYFYFGNFDGSVWINYLPWILILSRYLFMLVKWNHLPNLPIAREIRILLFYVFNDILNPTYIGTKNIFTKKGKIGEK
ncbi:MAG: hypothetical protein WC872_03615 [Candidatus Absconditabacterales bacterium]